MADQEEEVTVFLTMTAGNGDRMPLKVSASASPTELRQMASNVTKIPLSSLRLIFRGRMIKDDTTGKVVPEYKLEKDCVIHCMGKPELETSATATSTATATGSTVSVPRNNAAMSPGVTATTATANSLQAAIAVMKASNPPSSFLLGITTLVKVLNNIINNPMEIKFRRVKKQNPAFQKRLGALVGAEDAMKAIGFVIDTHDGDEVYMMHASADAWPKLVQSKNQVEQAANEAQATTGRSGAPPPAAAAAAAAAMPPPVGAGFPGFPMMGGAGMAGMPQAAEMQNAMAGLMSDPDALRTMLQNPTVQQMLQNDPNVPPMLRQSIEQLASNPAMVNQLSQMMRDPMMRQRIQTMVGSNPGGMGGGFGGMPPMGGAGGFGGMPMGGNSANNQQSNNANSGNDQDQTEEEMIAEAIRRSLEEG